MPLRRSDAARTSPKKKKDAPGPSGLVDRLVTGGSRTIAFVGLAAGSGRTTVIRSVLSGLAERGVQAGIAAAGWKTEDLEAAGGPATLTLDPPEGTVVATTVAALEQSTAGIETLESAGDAGSVGPLRIARVRRRGEIEVIGPGTGKDLRATVEAIRRHTAGPVLIEGTLGRRAFSAPGVADTLVLAAGGGMAPTSDRILPAVRYYLDLFSCPPAPVGPAALFDPAERDGRCILSDADGGTLDSFHWKPRDNAPSLLARADLAPAHAIVPGTLTDETVVPLLRESFRIGFVVRDPMRIVLSPVYHAAWLKRGGGLSVIHRARVTAVAINPVNPKGPDFDARELLAELRGGLPSVSVHDVVREADDARPKKRWFRRGGNGGSV